MQNRVRPALVIVVFFLAGCASLFVDSTWLADIKSAETVSVTVYPFGETNDISNASKDRYLKQIYEQKLRPKAATLFAKDLVENLGLLGYDAVIQAPGAKDTRDVAIIVTGAYITVDANAGGKSGLQLYAKFHIETRKNRKRQNLSFVRPGFIGKDLDRNDINDDKKLLEQFSLRTSSYGFLSDYFGNGRAPR